MSLIRQVRNETSHSFTLMVPGYDTTQSPPVVLNPSVIVDLLSLITGDQLEAVQGQLNNLLLAGDITDQGDISSIKAALAQAQIVLPNAPTAAVGYTQADIQTMVNLLNQLKATVNAMNA